MNDEARQRIEAGGETPVCLACGLASPAVEIEVRVSRLSSSLADVQEAFPYPSLRLVVPVCERCSPRYLPRPYPKRSLLALVIICIVSPFLVPLAEPWLAGPIPALAEAGPWLLCIALIGLYWMREERRAERTYGLHPSYGRLKAAGYSSRYEPIPEPTPQPAAEL